MGDGASFLEEAHMLTAIDREVGEQIIRSSPHRENPA